MFVLAPNYFNANDSNFKQFKDRHKAYTSIELQVRSLDNLSIKDPVQDWEILPVHDYIISCAVKTLKPVSTPSEDALIVGSCGQQIGLQSLQALVSPSGWLDDNIMLSCLAAIAAIQSDNGEFVARPTEGRVMTMDTWFGKLLMEETAGNMRLAACNTKKLAMDLKDVYSITIPINYGQNHWVIVYCNFKKKAVFFMDSLHSKKQWRRKYYERSRSGWIRLYLIWVDGCLLVSLCYSSRTTTIVVSIASSTHCASPWIRIRHLPANTRGI